MSKFDIPQEQVSFSDISKLDIALTLIHANTISSAECAIREHNAFEYQEQKYWNTIITELLGLHIFDLSDLRDAELKKEFPAWREPDCNRPFFSDDELSDKPVFIDDFAEAVPF